ncbi:MAG: hypothetical protein HKL80_04770 [Acidimicrobiales bacterium]|nr:hypothetical protein [Acidimicrobiales bacterium]
MDNSTIEISERARNFVLGALESEAEENLGLFIEVSGESDGEYQYDLYFQDVNDKTMQDTVYEVNGLKVVIPSSSVKKLSGAKLDMSDEQDDSQLFLVNPNRPTVRTLSEDMDIPGDLSSPEALKIVEILDKEINPAIASHGGYAELVSVDGSTAYVRMMGGCQGCGMAAVTLSQGIEVAIKDGVPEIEDVVDVTNHSAGTNPFYASSKK